ncbi:hypothetical protein [Pedobacter punctiformis]|uniref:Uncharacterized protein n=1 Tax=Pedobacter punctiformis TaxID=3004097 RepID=A0ABT4LB27_9SPHI|nr:hypothetical protein [Pedobacter sp. HCMS5-2]MCZ4245108.1 hypothetical protein [Pedobacter sp. HCMS5-2]
MPYTLMGIFFMISAPLKLFTLITAELYINNMPVFHLLAFVEISMVYCFYCYLIQQRINYWGILVLLVFNGLNTLFIQSIYGFNSLAWTLNMILLIVMGLMYFFRLYKDDEDYTPLEQRPTFIIAAAWLIYASGSLFTYLMGTEILSGKPEGFFNNAWVFQSISNISKNLIISYGLWLTKK